MSKNKFEFTEEERGQIEKAIDHFLIVGEWSDYSTERLIDRIEHIVADSNRQVFSVPYQLCPKCNGQGQVSKPPYIAGDVHEWSSSEMIFQCDVCNGSKIIPMFTLPNPPKEKI